MAPILNRSEAAVARCDCRVPVSEFVDVAGFPPTVVPASGTWRGAPIEPDWAGRPSFTLADAKRLAAAQRAEVARRDDERRMAEAAAERRQHAEETADRAAYHEGYVGAGGDRGGPKAHQAGVAAIRRRRGLVGRAVDALTGNEITDQNSAS